MRLGVTKRMLTRGDCQCERLWPRTGLGAPASVAISRALPQANPLRLLAVSYFPSDVAASKCVAKNSKSSCGL
jgi:hypothetical protein